MKKPLVDFEGQIFSCIFQSKNFDIIPILGTLTIHPVENIDDGDYVCIASNTLGKSFSSTRSLIVTGKQIH